MEKETTSMRLRKIMSMRNLKQVDILEKCKPYCEAYGEKLNKSHLSQYVSGITEPNQRKLVILALALDVDEAWLMGLDVPMKKTDHVDFSDESAYLVSQIRKDKELTEALKIYFSLSEEKKAFILQSIKVISINE